MRQVCSILARSLSTLIFVALAAQMLPAQQSRSRDLRLISARAGGINYVAGDARVRSAGQTAWRALDTSHDLSSGDAVKTGTAGRLEVLLNPGSYMRAGEHTEFEMINTSLEDLRLKLTRGSVVVEAFAYDKQDPAITVETPQTEVAIIKSGVYRLNVLPGGLTEVVVVKGRAAVGEPPTIVKGDKVARVGGGGLEVVKYDKKRRDELDLWSKERAGDLAEANRSISRRTVRTLLASTRWESIFPSASATYSPSGVWVFNQATRCYTFIPLYGGRSPYGSSHDSQFYPYTHVCRTCDGRNGAPPFANAGGTIVYPTSNAPSGGGGSMPAPSREMGPTHEYSRPPVAEGGLPSKRDQ